FLPVPGYPRHVHPFPTRRSSDLPRVIDDPDALPAAPKRLLLHAERSGHVADIHAEHVGLATMLLGAGRDRVEDAVDPAVGVRILDRKSTRLNSSHVSISYAVFCL